MKKRKSDTSFVILKDPYATTEDSISDIYQKYLADSTAIIESNNLVYHKVIQLYNLTIGTKTHSIVVLDAKMQLDLNDKLVDDCENYFEVKEFVMCRISPSDFPQWYQKIMFVSIKGDISSLGDYLARVK